jgi:hypothetical protein
MVTVQIEKEQLPLLPLFLVRERSNTDLSSKLYNVVFYVIMIKTNAKLLY